MAKDVFVVSTCDVWKTYSTFGLVGIFTTRKKLNPVLNKMLKERSITWNDETCDERFVNNLTDNDLNVMLDYVYIEKITLNEKQ